MSKKKNKKEEYLLKNPKDELCFYLLEAIQEMDLIESFYTALKTKIALKEFSLG